MIPAQASSSNPQRLNKIARNTSVSIITVGRQIWEAETFKLFEADASLVM